MAVYLGQVPTAARLSLHARLVWLACAMAPFGANAQERSITQVGLGIGLDFGGIGARLDLFPVEHVSVFGGAGFLPGSLFGYNAGVQVIPVPKWKDALFLCGMYGINTVIIGETRPEKNDLLTGFSYGIGTRISNKARTGVWKLSLLFPVRTGEAADLEDHYSLLPVAVSFGYHFIQL